MLLLTLQNIRGVLADLGPQSVASLHRILSHDKDYAMTADELAVFMVAAKRAGRLSEGRDGKWNLPE